LKITPVKKSLRGISGMTLRELHTPGKGEKYLFEIHSLKRIEFLKC